MEGKKCEGTPHRDSYKMKLIPLPLFLPLKHIVTTAVFTRVYMHIPVSKDQFQKGDKRSKYSPGTLVATSFVKQLHEEMVDGHIPAWKRIAILKRKQQETGELDLQEDPLNVTVHLATGALSRKEKKRIIKGDTSVDTGKDLLPNTDKRIRKKKEKLAKEERVLNKTRVLRDQLRYLIDFYRTKVDDRLPSSLCRLDAVKLNYPEAIQLKPGQEDEDTENKEGEEEPHVVEVWKFSKQKQNWLLKHFFNVEEIPLAYDDLLVSYFRDLKGGSRTDLMKKCLSQIQLWNSYVEEEENKIKAVVDGTDTPNLTSEESKGVREEEEHPEEGKPSESATSQHEKKEGPETVIPDRDVVLRSYKLLTAWRELGGDDDDDNNELSTLEMKQFG